MARIINTFMLRIPAEAIRWPRGLELNAKSPVLGAIKSSLHPRTRKWTLFIGSSASWDANIGIQSASKVHWVSLERSRTGR